MKVLTAEQMAYLDRITIEQGTPGINLMRKAGSEVFRLVDEICGVARKSRIVVLAGKGNNGGDGFRVAELLARNVYDSAVYLAGSASDVRGDAAVCMNDAMKAGQKIVEIKSIDDVDKLSRDVRYADVIVDALFGTGLRGEVTGLTADIIDLINAVDSTVVAVDIPSGVNASTGEMSQHTVEADYTLTFGCLKTGHVLMPGKRACGKVKVVDIGFSREVLESMEPYAHTIIPTEAAGYLPQRPYDAHKGSVGRVFVLAGSVGMTGAATLASYAAMRVGAGLVTLGCPASLNDIFEVKLTEVMTLPLPEVRKKRCLSLRALGIIRDSVQKADIVAVGPGLGMYCETSELVRRFISQYTGRVVLDADGINAFKGDSESLHSAPCQIIITPHMGELSNLLSVPVSDIAADPVASARKASEITGKIILLKGAPTLIADPHGTIWINSTGNEGMATAGMGDVLTGVISGLAAQGLDLSRAAVLGAYVHGLAGEIASEKKGKLGVISGDVLESLSTALLNIQNKIS